MSKNARCHESTEYRAIMEKLLECRADLVGIDPKKILVLENLTEKKRWVARMVRVCYPYNLLQPGTEFILEVSAKWVEFMKMGPKNKALLIYHELLHIGRTKDGGYCLVDHTLKDFSNLIEKCGVHWEVKEDVPDILAESEAQKDAVQEIKRIYAAAFNPPVVSSSSSS